MNMVRETDKMPHIICLEHTKMHVYFELVVEN